MKLKTISIDYTTSKQPGSVTQTSIAATVYNKSKRVLAFCMASRGTVVSSATYNGDSFVRAKRSTAFDGCSVDVWYLVSPTIGTHNIIINFSGIDQNTTVGVISMSDANITDPIQDTDEQSGSGSSYSKTLTTEIGGVVIHGFMHSGTKAGDPSANETILVKRVSNDSSGSAYEKNCTSASTTVGWSGFYPTDSSFSAAMVSFRPATIVNAPILMLIM